MGNSTAAVGIEGKWGGKSRSAAFKTKQFLVLFHISLSQSFPPFLGGKGIPSLSAPLQQVYPKFLQISRSLENRGNGMYFGLE